MIGAIPGLSELGKAFAYVLHWLATLVGGNYGLAIILLTVLMRIVILPLSIKQTKSMIEMQKLQPQLKEIQKKYKDDREKQGQAMMALYKENKVSPLGGCLPLLLQLPIIFAVFEVLRNLANTASDYFRILFPGQNPKAFNVAAAPQLQFAGMNITYTGSQLVKAHDVWQLIVLILLTVATGYVSAKMMTTDPKQSKMMAMMPIIMGVFAWILPAGVTIYIIVTNLFTMVQQYIQLERDGFYDEKLNAIRKLGESAKWYSRLYLQAMDLGTKTLIAVKLRPKPEPPKPDAKKASKAAKAAKPAGKTGVKAAGKPIGAKGSKAQAAKKQAAPAGKQQAKKKQTAGAQKQQPQGIEKRPASKKASSKNYPAKKKSSGKR